MNRKLKYWSKTLLLVICCFSAQGVYANIKLNYKNIELEKILRDYGNKTGLAFSYSSNTLALGKKYTIVGEVDNKEAGVALICSKANLKYKFLGNMVVLKQKPKVRKPTSKKEEPKQIKQEEQVQEEEMEYILPVGWVPDYKGPGFPDFKLPEAVLNPKVDEDQERKDNKWLYWLNNGADFSGHQNAVLWNKNTTDHTGREVAFLFNRTKGFVKGTQVSFMGNVAQGGYGTQVGVLCNLSKGSHKGNQISVLCNFAGDDSGLRVQTSGFLNKNKGDTHAQVGTVNINGKSSEGQYGIFNVNGGDSGKQFGLLNINKGKVGRQFGLVNVADTCDYRSLGLVNFIRKGYNRIEIGYNSEFALNSSLRFGHERLYTIIGIALDWDYLNGDVWSTEDWSFNRGALNLGFGGWLYSKGRICFMQEIMVGKIVTTDRGFANDAYLYKYGISGGVRLGKRRYNSTFIFGIHLNVFSQNEEDQINIKNLDFISKSRFQLWDRRFDLWPGLKVGFRF